jgi:outer membrane receptor protein involved in Fe transport|tara:strand:+ start:80 stop:565 length:486 start_codon:yes stop_codon:yes gene_type:complete
MRIYLSILLIFLTGLAKVQSQTNEKGSVIKNSKIVSSQTLVDALANRIPGARKITDKYGNGNIALRGRQSFKTSGNQVLWEIDGIIYPNPPTLNVNQVKYVEVLKGLAATNKYGSEGAGGVIIVKTNVNPEKINSGRNLWTPKKVKPKKVKKKKKKKKSKK